MDRLEAWLAYPSSESTEKKISQMSINATKVRKHVHGPSSKLQAGQAWMMKRESRHLTVHFSLHVRWVTVVKCLLRMGSPV